MVVPRREPGVHEYLQRSLACVKDVEVVLDRRAVAVRPADERRRQSAKSLLICSLVHCPIEAPASSEPPTATTDNNRRRTLLWPDLRLEHL